MDLWLFVQVGQRSVKILQNKNMQFSVDLSDMDTSIHPYMTFDMYLQGCIFEPILESRPTLQ